MNEERNKKKVLCLNAEIRSLEGANIVIEKIKKWISENNLNENNVFKIKPKKIIENPIKKITNHAINILEGINENDLNIKQNTNNSIKSNKNDTVSHASDLL